MAKKKNEAVQEESSANPKRDAVQKAMEALGDDASIPSLNDYITQHLGLDIENKVIGVHRHHILRSQGKKPVKSTARKQSRGGVDGEVTLEEIRWVRQMVKRHGVARLRDLIDLLS